jgi:ABC-type nitrate/sulfonate/bicarbonate transport system ATPase subunit
MGRIVLDKVSKSFDKIQVIPPLDLTIEDGEFTVFVGPSGCGKSTLLRMIAGLEDLSAGTIFVDNEDVTQICASKAWPSNGFPVLCTLSTHDSSQEYCLSASYEKNGSS